MATFIVIEEREGAWDWARDLREQDGWDAHAAFMDRLVEEGFVRLGGPFGDGRRVLLVVDAPDEAAVETRLAEDPWTGVRLRVASVERWEVLLGG
jgi:hypothetical protein